MQPEVLKPSEKPWDHSAASSTVSLGGIIGGVRGAVPGQASDVPEQGSGVPGPGSGVPEQGSSDDDIADPRSQA